MDSEVYNKWIEYQRNMLGEELDNAFEDKKVCVLAMVKRRIDAGMPEEQAIKEAMAIGNDLFEDKIKAIKDMLVFWLS
jgi:hypothetical protein